MSKVFRGPVSIILNTRNEIALKRDPEGKFSAESASELYETLTRLAKRYKAPINKYTLFIADGGKNPVLLANRFGAPYLALLPDAAAAAAPGATAYKKTVKKLA